MNMDEGADDGVRVRHLGKTFVRRGGLFSLRTSHIHAVRNVSFSIPRGKTLGLMGESGCGKTTAGLLILRLIEATSGEVSVFGHDVMSLDKRGLKAFRRDAQIILQNPKEALDLRRRVRSCILEPLTVHGLLKARQGELADLARRVGLQEQHLNSFPGALSGGAQQRVCICRALILKPQFVVLDEPTSSLDVSVQARVLDLLKSLQEDLGLTYLFISHAAAVLRYVCDWIGVMYLGEIVEYGPAEKVFGAPKHPYTRALCDSVLTTAAELEGKELRLLGSPVSPSEIPTGCAFEPRCPEKSADCGGGPAEFLEVEPGHFVACRLAVDRQLLDAGASLLSGTGVPGELRRGTCCDS